MENYRTYEEFCEVFKINFLASDIFSEQSTDNKKKIINYLFSPNFENRLYQIENQFYKPLNKLESIFEKTLK